MNENNAPGTGSALHGLAPSRRITDENAALATALFAAFAAAPALAGTYPSFDLPKSVTPARLSVRFTVDVDGVKNVFPAELTLRKGQLSGTIDAFGATANVDPGSTDKKSQLNLKATIPNATSFTLVGTLKFKAGTGSGIFTDGSVTGTYTAKKS